MFLVMCPKCRNSMKYESQDMYVGRKSKRCVYCGKSFKVSDNLVKRLD